MTQFRRDFYVYEHRRLSDDGIFYIGKGRGDRAFSRAGRNRHWRFIVDKHGYKSEIVRGNMSEACAFTLEKCLIALHGGPLLSNMTTGGEGASGLISSRRKTVYCSNGMVFHSTMAAAEWLVSIGREKAKPKAISSALSGKKDVVYGFRWSNISTPDLDPETAKNPKLKCGRIMLINIYCSNGMSFDGPRAASIFAFGHKNGYNKILSCCKGLRGSAGGLTWSFTPNDIPQYENPKKKAAKSKMVPVACSNGMKFKSTKHAIDWLSENTGKTYTRAAIYQAIKRNGKCAGLRWERK